MKQHRGNSKTHQGNGHASLNRGLTSLEKAVKERYALGAKEMQPSLCCPVEYEPKYLKVISKEILEKDYGCGDPSRYLKEGDVVLDLGSGGGKICYIASQVVGPSGKVIGVDFNPAMLVLARKYQKEIGERIGWHNVEFKWGKIQDLKTDVEVLKQFLESRPVDSVQGFFDLKEAVMEVQAKSPLIPDGSVDIVVSNCVLNLVRSEHKQRLFSEMFRVLKRGGRVAISDIVSDEWVPEDMQRDPELWSGCISGAFEEKAFVKAFEDAGFYGIEIEKRDEKPWRTVRGIEFRSVTLTAYKGKEGECWERNQAVIYRGPWKQVWDDDGHVLKRGVRTAVCDKTFQIYTRAPYQDQIISVNPRKNIPLSKAQPFSATKKADPRLPSGGQASSGGDCKRSVERHPRETKGVGYKASTEVSAVCREEACC